MTKVLCDEHHRIIGAGIVGTNAGELIVEAVLALEMDPDVQDLALTIHPHPTLSETLSFAAEVAEGAFLYLLFPLLHRSRTWERIPWSLGGITVS
jgi:dihydrolipoamide dehydrogenase